MKKIILLIALLSAMFATSASGQVVKGDMNDDGKIDISDLNDIVNTVLGLKPLQYIQSQVVKGDMNDDGKIDISDLNDIVNTILGNSPLQYVHEYVDLGLPSGTLWATTNVGADNPEDYGLYFAWGETKGYAYTADHSFNWANYKWCNGSETKMTKYSTSTTFWDQSLGTSPDNKSVLEAEDDAATANWGSGWRMPSLAQLQELTNSNYTTTKWTTMNGVKGCKITSKSNGNSIFLPAAGFRFDTYLRNAGSWGGYWSCELFSTGSSSCYLYCSSSSVDSGGCYRYYGRNVRAVRVPSE